MMRTQTLIKQLLILLSLTLASINTQAQESKGFLWKVSDHNSSVYLLGSVHFANASYYPMSQSIERAFAEAEILAVEIDITAFDPLQAQKIILEKGLYSGGKTLQQEISSQTFEKLNTYLNENGLPPHLYLGQKPGLLIINLTSSELINLGMLPQFGIDLHFLTRAKGNKHIVELETFESQMDLLLNIEDGDAALSQTLDEFPSFPVLSKQLFKAWQTGDTRAMEKLLIEEPLQKYPESQDYFDKLFTDRNITMTEKVKGFLAEDKTYFVVVGAGHLIGDAGIVGLLQKAGFETQRN